LFIFYLILFFILDHHQKFIIVSTLQPPLHCPMSPLTSQLYLTTRTISGEKTENQWCMGHVTMWRYNRRYVNRCWLVLTTFDDVGEGLNPSSSILKLSSLSLYEFLVAPFFSNIEFLKRDMVERFNEIFHWHFTIVCSLLELLIIFWKSLAIIVESKEPMYNYIKLKGNIQALPKSICK
jgi:hypothetical protein